MRDMSFIFNELYETLLNHYDSREAANIASIMWEDVFLKNKNEKILLSEETISLIEEFKIRINQNEPMQYILGEADFYGYKFKVTPSVLIPRAETEELVYHIINKCKIEKNYSPAILDIGTGSACIPIVLNKKISNSKVFAIDVSEDALKIALINSNRLEAKVDFIQANILDDSFRLEMKFNIIVSNPPYIPYSESNLMPHHVLKHEPHLALFVENDDPLIFYKKIIDFSQTHLENDGYLFFETNENNAKEVIKHLEIKKFNHIELIKDMSGKDRIISAQKSSAE